MMSVLTLIWVGRSGGGGDFNPPPPFLLSWFSLNNSERVEAITLSFCSIQQHFIREILANFVISKSAQSTDIEENSDGGISDFLISSQSLFKETCHNSRISDDIDIKLGPVPELDKRNKTTSKKFDNVVMLENYETIAIFPIYRQFGAIWKPDFGRIVCKTYILINGDSFCSENWKQNLKISNTTLTILSWVKVLFLPKITDFCKKCWRQQN